MRTLSIIAGVLCVAGGAVSAQASLVSYSSDGVGLVYSSETNVTWLGNGNLLGNWIAADGVQNVYDAIDAVTPTINLPDFISGATQYTLSLSDYSSWWGDNGATTFYGALAFVNYLNSISYAGSNQWQLPNAENSVYEDPVLEGYTRAGDLGQLYYDEAGASAGFGFGSGTAQAVGDFPYMQSGQYWSENLTGSNIWMSVGFNMGNGQQYEINSAEPYFVLPDVTGMVPEPGVMWLLAPGLLLAARRRRGSATTRVD